MLIFERHCKECLSILLLGVHQSLVHLCNFCYVQHNNKRRSISHIPSLYSYMAPNQLRGHAADQPNDIYGLGVLLYESVTRSKMQDVNKNLLAHHNEKEELRFRLKLIPKTFEPSIHVLIKACLSSAGTRPTSSQVYNWLDALLEGRLTTTSPTTMMNENKEQLTLTSMSEKLFKFFGGVKIFYYISEIPSTNFEIPKSRLSICMHKTFLHISLELKFQQRELH
ncbi:uncharacterized protein LOC130653726 [Hydractinia symbiolongicarpus]|uniref:uncharacterized protein LOC130653726 n=1 Tax=Hydractinia symbiolongicarpus TaxID=13093 RepID=UPI00254F8FBD|nr:uncharacterized protein LOC130653726 [Hydractinia symbiolongicarpus]